jgi:16S rRNA (cytosine1402-N4)-methyltransferase
MKHETVLLHETVDGLNLKSGAIVFDGTLGGGGHSAEIALRHKDTVKIIGTDRDAAAIKRTEERLKDLKSDFHLFLSDYRALDKILDEQKIEKIDGLILDLGLSSNQIDESARGFSFKNEEPLLMTFAESSSNPLVTAESIVNSWSEETLADIIYAYGDERYARRIARTIIESREHAPIKTTTELVAIISSAVPAFYRHGRLHFATKTFQALRIATNDELGALKEGLLKAFDRLRIGGRMSIITFHSGEDRIVKNFYREKAKEEVAKLINKKPILPTDEETQKNPRARSAKLRILEKIK